MKKIVLVGLAILIAVSALAQTKPPQAKSQKELEAIMAVQNAPDPDTRIMAAQNLLKKFKDTEFKEISLFFIMLAYQQKNDFENMLLFGEQVLDENPDNLATLLSLAMAIPLRTREFDFDRDDKLARAEDFAKRALALIPNAEPPGGNPIPPEEWLNQKKDFMAQANESLGMVAAMRKEYETAEGFYRMAVQQASDASSTTYFRLAEALRDLARYDEALEAVDQSIAKGGVQGTTGEDLAVRLKKQIEQFKAKGIPSRRERERKAGAPTQIDVKQ